MFFHPGMKRVIDELHFLIYQENIDLYSWKYNFYDIKDNQIKNCNIFSPYMQLKNKGLAFQDIKKTKKVSCYHRRSK